MAQLGRLLLIAIACITPVSAVPTAEAQVVVTGPHRRYHHRRYYHHPNRRYHRRGYSHRY